MLNGKSASTLAQSAIQKSVHFTLGSSIVPKTEQVVQQSQINNNGHPEITQTTAINCALHGRPLKGFCIDPEYKKKRKLCVDCLWENPVHIKMVQTEFIKTLQNKITISGPQFFEQLNKIIKKDHLQQDIDEMFLNLKNEMDQYINDLYSQFMWWSKHGMGNQTLMKDHILSEILFNEKIVTEIAELVLTGRPMEACDETIDVCAEIINSDAQVLATLPSHLKQALGQCELIIKNTLKEIHDAFKPFKDYPFDFKNIPSDVYVPALRIPGTQGSLGQFGLKSSYHQPGMDFINSTSQMNSGSQMKASAISTSFHGRFNSQLASNLSPKLFADARDLHQSQIWALCKVSSQIIASGDWQGNIKLVGLTPNGQYQFIQSLNHGKNVYALTMAYGQDNILLSAGQNEKDEWTIKIWDIERARMVRECKGHMNYIFSIVMPNQSQIVSCSYDETVRVWDFENGANITIFKEFKTSFNDLCIWSQHEIITCSDDKAIRLFNINTGQMKMQIFDQYFVNGICKISQNEIAVGNFKGEILIINIPDQKIIRRMGSHKNFVWRVRALDADLLATASFDKTVKIWEWKSGSLVSSLEGHTEIIRALEIIEDNYFLISASDDKSLKIWRLI